MKKLNIAIIFGGKSNEHIISCYSALSILNHIDNKKYNIYIIWINKDGKWYYLENLKFINDIINKRNFIKSDCYLTINKEKNGLVYNNKFVIIDCIFPILHGKTGEDGIIQGLLELCNIPYVGCNVLSSSICMNKYISKLILSKYKIPMAKYIVIKKNDFFKNINVLIKKINLMFPVFIKPTSSGSSIGTYKSLNLNDCILKIKKLFEIYNEIIIEEFIIGTEIEVGILGNNKLIVSSIGEIRYNSEFYDYETKYQKNNSVINIPATMPQNIYTQCQEMSKKIFNILNCKGIARIDYFLTNDCKIIFNEINTMPGFTVNSMYPKLFNNIGINYLNLIDKLIELAMEE